MINSTLIWCEGIVHEFRYAPIGMILNKIARISQTTPE
jgi:hypothetical protein